MKKIFKLNTVRASGNRESWFKTVTGIIEGATGAKGFAGDYLKPGENRIDVGTIILHVWPSGSTKHGLFYADLHRITAEGTVAEIVTGLNWKTEYPSIQDAAAKALASPQASQDTESELEAMFASFATPAMLAELERRGVSFLAVTNHEAEEHAVEEHAVEEHTVEEHTVEGHTVEEHTVEGHTVEGHTVEGHTS